MKTKVSLLLIMVSSLMLPQIGMAAKLVITGSTTVQKRVLEPAAAAITSATGVKLTARGTSSGKGFKRLISGADKASMSSSPLRGLLEKNGLPDDGTYQEHVIVKDVIVPIVHPSNPISALTFQQLADINAGKITNWKEVGGEDRKIVVITSQPGSATRSVFQKIVMNKAGYAKRARAVASTRQEINLVAKFKGGIGALSQGFVAMSPGKVKVIKTDAISRPLSIITKGDPEPDMKKVIGFLQSADARKHFK